MRRNIVETVMGALVLAVAVLFLAFAYTGSNLRPAGGYDLIARFNRVDGLANGAEVRRATSASVSRFWKLRSTDAGSPTCDASGPA